MECIICISAFNKSTRKHILCGYCDFEVCQTCAKKYLLQTTQDPHCMNCRHAWNREFLDSIFPSAFIEGQLKKHRCKILYEREKSLMPETLPLLAIRKTINGLEEEKLQWQKQLEDIRKTKSMHYVDMRPSKEARFQYWEDEAKYNIDSYVVKENIALLRNKILYLRNHGDIEEKARNQRFIRCCPSQGCRGFLSTQWKCELCDIWVCHDCHEIKGLQKNIEHTCKPENVETAKLLAKDTKPCPKCATPIFKISGCDQIWCTQCHIAFSWNTGLIEKGIIHNPHYYEYMRQTHGVVPRQPGDIPCGGLPSVQDLFTKHEFKRNTKIVGTVPTNTLLDIHRLFYDMANLKPEYRVNHLDDNRDLRVRYLLNEIDDERFMTLLQIREKKDMKKTEIYQVIDTFCQVIVDMFQRMLNTDTQELKNSDYMQEFDGIKEYYNNSITKIMKRYNSSIKNILITEKWSRY